MKFKVGDRVRHEDFGIGVVKFYDEKDGSYAVEFENWNVALSNCNGYSADRRGAWFGRNQLELVKIKKSWKKKYNKMKRQLRKCEAELTKSNEELLKYQNEIIALLEKQMIKEQL